VSFSNRREEEAIAKKSKRRINGEGSIYQRKSDGRWVGQFKDPAAPGGGIRYVYAKTQQEALKKLKALKLEDVESLFRSMAVSGLSPATVRYVHAVMRRALGQAVMRGLIPRNVAEGASLPGLGREEAQYLTPEQVKSLLMAAKGNRLEALYIVAVSCGLRQGELLGLRWEEVDLEGHRLTVRRQVQRSRDGCGLIFVPTKGKKSRAIRLASATGSARPKKWRRRRASGRTPVSCSPAP
jgi:integrase